MEKIASIKAPKKWLSRREAAQELNVPVKVFDSIMERRGLKPMRLTSKTHMWPRKVIEAVGVLEEYQSMPPQEGDNQDEDGE